MLFLRLLDDCSFPFQLIFLLLYILLFAFWTNCMLNKWCHNSEKLWSILLQLDSIQLIHAKRMVVFHYVTDLIWGHYLLGKLSCCKFNLPLVFVFLIASWWKHKFRLWIFVTQLFDDASVEKCSLWRQTHSFVISHGLISISRLLLREILLVPF